MMKTIWNIILLAGLVSCVNSSDLDYLASIEESEGNYNSSRRRFTRSSNDCEDSERCENICDQILDDSSERRNCYKLSLREIGIVEEIFDVLKAVDDLNDIRAGNFDLFTSIALQSWSNLIRGTYRRDERNDDDDEDMDDGGRPEYDVGEAQAVLNWIIENKSIAESIRDFSSRDDHIISDLLVRAFDGASNDPLNCPSRGDTNGDVCNDLDDSIINDEKRILYSIKNNPYYLPEIVRFSSSDDEVSAMYEMTHNVLSRVCESADISNRSSDHSYKICLSWIYFCDPSVYVGNQNQIDQYLLKDTYLSVPQGFLLRCEFLDPSDPNDEPEWSDYWD